MNAFIPVVAVAPRCPACGATLNSICGHDRLPRSGDYNICGECLAVLRFTGVAFGCRLALAQEFEADVTGGTIASSDEVTNLVRMCFARRAARTGLL